MVVAHGLAPIAQGEIRIGLLGFLEGRRGFVEREAVQILHAFDEVRLRRLVRRGRKLDGPERFDRPRTAARRAARPPA